MRRGRVAEHVYLYCFSAPGESAIATSVNFARRIDSQHKAGWSLAYSQGADRMMEIEPIPTLSFVDALKYPLVGTGI